MVQQLVGDGGDAWLQLRHHARRESLRDQIAQLAMAWRVHLQDAGPDRVGIALGALSLRHTLSSGRESRILAQHARHVGVTKDVPATPVRILEDGLRGTHRAIPIKRSLELLFMALCLHIFYLSSLNGLTALFSFSTIQRTKGL